MHPTWSPDSHNGRAVKSTMDRSAALDRPEITFERYGHSTTNSSALELLEIFRRHKVLIASVFLLVSLIGISTVLLMPPAYTADATVLFDPRKRQVVSSEPVLGRAPADSQVLQTVVESELQRILSLRVVNPVIDQFHLLADPEFNQTLRKTWITSIQSWSVIPPAIRDAMVDVAWALGMHQKVRDPEAERQEVITAVLKRLSAQVQGHSTAIKIAFWSQNARKSAAIVNAIAHHYVQLAVQDNTSAVEDALSTLNKRSDELRNKAADAESAAEKYRTAAHLSEDSGGTDITSMQITQTTMQVVQAEADLARAQAELMQTESVSTNPGAAPDVLRSPVVERLREEEAKEAADLAEVQSRSGATYPVVVARQAALNAVRMRINTEISNIVRSSRVSRDGALARVRLLQEQISDMWRQVEHLSPSEIQYHQLKLEANVRHSLYEEFLRRTQEISQQLGTAQPDSQLISPAEIPLRASWPNLRLMVPCILLAAFTLAAGLAVCADLFTKGFRSLRQVMETFDDRSFVLVPRLSGRRSVFSRRSFGLSAKTMNGAYAEAIHSLRVQLRSSGSEIKTVLFASAIEAEGKTMTALAFARQEAQSGLKVLMIDADLRRPTLHSIFGGPRAGLAEVLSGKKSFDEVLQYNDASNLAYIAAGKTGSSPIDLLSDTKMQEVLQAGEARFDRIVVDSPAVLAVADARVLTKLVNRTVYIVQWARTPRDLALLGFDMLRQSGASLIGPVFVRVDGQTEVYGGASYVKNYMLESQHYE